MKDGSEASYEVLKKSAGEVRAMIEVRVRSVSVADELAKLGALRDDGTLSDAEFEAQKAHLLGR